MNTPSSYLQWAKDVFAIEQAAIAEVAASLDYRFNQAVEAILNANGRVVITGMGKSGHIGRKIAASLASTGTPAFFIHPAEAAHGDLGMVVDGDVIIALSNSGENDEILAIIPAIKRKNVRLICITGKPQSSMAQHADIHLLAAVSQEACPFGLAPTSSTTAVLVLGDALTVALLRARAFTPEDFALSHPAGSLGKRLLLRVGDIMRKDEALPLAQADISIRDGILIMSQKGLGILIVVDPHQRLQGIFTDGDLRRVFEKYDKVTGMTVGEVMHPNPQTIAVDKLATEALKQMEDRHISSLLVTDDEGRLSGVVTMLDLLNARIA